MRNLVVFFVSAVVLASTLFAEEDNFIKSKPLVPSKNSWPTGSYWTQKKIGDREFYFAEQGNYIRTNAKRIVGFEQVDLLRHFIPGHWNFKYFDPETYSDKKMNPYLEKLKALSEEWVEKKWPFHSIQYCTAKGNPVPSKEAYNAVGDLWIGDGHPEIPVYRIEPIFHYIKTGKKWRGSSMGYTDDDSVVSFFHDQLMPLVEKEFPFYRDKNHQWTRQELKKLYNMYCEQWFKKVGKGKATGMYLSPYYMAMLPEITTVEEKAADAFSNARARGVMRQSGGDKFYFTWRGHEPTERYAYYYKGRILYHDQDRDAQGYPLPHIWYYFFRPFLIGSNYMVTEGIPGSLVQDIEGDGQYELSTLGHIYKSLIDFSERHPDRGTPYAPIALVRDAARSRTSIKGLNYMGFKFPRFDDADYMNEALLTDLIFPQHRHIRPSGYSKTCPYGEIFDILAPNQPGVKIDPKIFDGYKVLLGMGGLEIGKDYAKVLTDYIKNGGTLVLNVNDIGKNLDPAIFGVKILPDKLKGSCINNTLTGEKFDENEFTFQKVTLDGAKALYTCNGQPIVTKFKYGKGYTMLVTCNYMLQDKQITVKGKHGEVRKKPLLHFVDDFIENLAAGLTPFEVRRRKEDKPDISWLINKKGDGWTVTVFNYSLKREELVSKPMGTARVFAEYPYKAVPFEIVCKAPMKDVVELYDDRDVNYRKENGNIVVDETIRGGDIRVYEFQPHKIKLKPRKRCINYAPNSPVKASSTLKGYTPKSAVDGILNNDDFWQSDLDPERRYYFDMPQWLQVDLGGLKTVDHAFVLFHTWPQSQETLKTRQRIYQYVVEVSAEEDPKNWVTVIDESKNIDPARAEGLERWFKPIKARYARLRLLRNCSGSGAQVVEFKIMGPEQETYVPKRKSLHPAWKVQYPESISNIPEERFVYLADLKPLREEKQPGWMPAGKAWSDMHGTITLFTDRTTVGGEYKKSIYGHADSSIVYKIPAGCTKFVAAIGLGNKMKNSSVIFKVFVDGQERYNSKLYRHGMPVLPVVVDVTGGKELKLVVENAGDGIASDYSWWGEARFLRK